MVDAGLMDEDVLAIRKLAFAENRFEPFPNSLVTPSILAGLVRAGLAECGCSCRPAVGKIGYRLTEEGWRVAREFWTWSKPTALMFETPPQPVLRG